MKNYKILFLAFCMPPLKYPNSMMYSKLIKNMPIKPSVIYANEKDNNDFTILKNFNDYIEDKYQIPYRGENRYISYLKRIFLPLIYEIPDIYKNWSNKLYKVSSEYIHDNDIDTIVTFGQPMSVHLTGLKLKIKNPNVKWIAHFSDPWVDNPLNAKGYFTKKINIALEKDVFEYANKLIFTSRETIELESQRYQKNIISKMYYLPHCYDSDLYDYNKKYVEVKFTIRYIGGFYSQRSPEPLFKAIQKIIKSNEELLTNVVFEIVGNLGRHSKLLNKYSDIKQYFIFINNVSYQKSLELMLSSDVLLIIDAPSKRSVFFPSKLVDYIGSKKPIIAITSEGTSKNIITELNGRTANPEDIDSICSMLKEVLLNKDEYKNFIPNNNYKKYDAKVITKEFMDLIINV